MVQVGLSRWLRTDLVAVELVLGGVLEAPVGCDDLLAGLAVSAVWGAARDWLYGPGELLCQYTEC